MKDYYISFQVKDLQGTGYIRAIKVTIEDVLLLADDTQYDIGLCDDPLYEELERYVECNR